MAIIYSYPQAASALHDDRVVVTRIHEEGNEITTKQLTLGQIAEYLVEGSPLGPGSGTPNYIPMWGAGGGDLVDSIIYTTEEGSINVGIVPSKGGGTPEDPYWIDKFQVQGTMSVSGNVSIGTPRQLENQGFDLNILGEEGKIAFGDNNIFGDPEIPTPITWNVVVGEYGTGDTDVLQLHGKVGTKFTRGKLGDTVSMSIDSGGDVGIGTDSPSAKLHVSGGDIKLDDGDVKLGEERKITFNSSGSVTADDYLSIATGDGSTSVDFIGAPSALRFITGSSTAAYIDNQQNFGIGTTGPGAKLHVNDGNALITANGSNVNLRIERTDGIVDGAAVQIMAKADLGYIGTTNEKDFQIRQGGSVVAKFNNDGTNQITGDTAVTGNVTATNLSGTNTGDEVLTGYLKIAGNAPLSETLTNVVDGNSVNSGVQLNTSGDLKSRTFQSKLLTIEDYSHPDDRIDWLTNSTIKPTPNFTQINSNKSIRFSVGDNDLEDSNKMIIHDNGVIRINAIGINEATANLVCPGSFKFGNSMSINPANQTELTEADAGTMTYWEGTNKSRLFIVMKTGKNPDTYEQVMIKEIGYE